MCGNKDHAKALLKDTDPDVRKRAKYKLDQLNSKKSNSNS